MKKGIVIALAIAIVFLFTSCGIIGEKQIEGSWYQYNHEILKTSLGPGVMVNNSDGLEYHVNNIILDGIVTYVTLTFNYGHDIDSKTEVIQGKTGWYESEDESKWIQETITDTAEEGGYWYLENGRLYMNGPSAMTGSSFAVTIIGNTLILDNECTGTYITFSRDNPRD